MTGASDLVLPGGVRFVLLLNRALSDSEVAAVARWSWETHGVGLDLMNFSPGAWTGVSVGQVYWSPPAHMQPLSMAFCLECHRDPASRLRDPKDVYNLDSLPLAAQGRLDDAHKMRNACNHPTH